MRIAFLLFLFCPALLFAQDKKLTKKEITEAIDSLAAKLDRIYVFPAKATEMGKLIKKNLADGAYDQLTDPFAFSEQITKDLQSVTNDKHLNFRYAPQRIIELREEMSAAEPDFEGMKKEMGKSNFGFEEVSILNGNIGYIKFNGFTDASLGGDAASAAMNFVSHADAIIFDVRENGGGSPTMIQLLTSYLYPEGEPVHLNNFYFRPQDETTQTWTLPFVPGKRNPKALVYVLTSSYTFSAAEEFTYNLKNLKRGTIVGEVTGGGAHPGGREIITDLFMAFIPNGRAINPITETNWEGVGVIPDTKIAQQDALSKAHLMALDSLKETASDEMEKNRYQWHWETINAKLNPYKADEKKFKNYTGTFGLRTITLEDGKLFYQREGRPKFEMAPLSENLFMVPGIDVRVQFEWKEGKANAIVLKFENGESERSEKK